MRYLVVNPTLALYVHFFRIINNHDARDEDLANARATLSAIDSSYPTPRGWFGEESFFRDLRHNQAGAWLTLLLIRLSNVAELDWRAIYRKSILCDYFGQTVRGTTSDDWELPSPCTFGSVKLRIIQGIPFDLDPLLQLPSLKQLCIENFLSEDKTEAHGLQG